MGTSPRISFSHDFGHSDIIPVERHPLRSSSSGLSSSIDFDFCVSECLDEESSTAEELFSDGKILPTQIKKKVPPTRPTDHCGPHPPLPPARGIRDSGTTCGKGLKQENSRQSKGEINDADEKQSSKSFWRFKRSSSCGSGYGTSLCPILPLLSRSNSTGSTSSVKRSPFSNDGQNSRQGYQKHASIKASQSSASSSYGKPPLKKGHGSHGNGARISPVLNIHSANLFGFGSIFSNGKEKNKKK